MEIFAHGKSFAIAAVAMGQLEYKWNKDKTLSVWAGERSHPISISTQRGGFIEAVNEEGDIVGEGGDGQMWFLPLSKSPITLRFKKLTAPKLSKDQIQKHRKQVTRYLLQDAPYSLGIPDSLTGAIVWMQRKLRSIPKECRKSASFRFDTSTEYGETYPQLTISYSEPETDKEVIERIKWDGERRRITEAAERQKLKQLQKKYETKSVGGQTA